jgi:hypothetical protein
MGAELAQIPSDRHPVPSLQPFLCDRRRGHSHGRFPGRCAPASPMVTDHRTSASRYSRHGRDGTCRSGCRNLCCAGIFIPDQQGNRGAGRFPLEHTGENFDRIRLPSLRDVTGGPGLSAIEILLNVYCSERQDREGIRRRHTRWPVRGFRRMR